MYKLTKNMKMTRYEMLNEYYKTMKNSLDYLNLYFPINDRNINYLTKEKDV